MDLLQRRRLAVCLSLAGLGWGCDAVDTQLSESDADAHGELGRSTRTDLNEPSFANVVDGELELASPGVEDAGSDHPDLAGSGQYAGYVPASRPEMRAKLALEYPGDERAAQPTDPGAPPEMRYPEQPNAEPGRACNATHRQHVEVYDGTLGVTTDYVDTFSPTAYAGGCDGTLIGRDLVVTAAHCNTQVGQVVPFPHQLDAAGNPRPDTNFPVVEVIEQRTINADIGLDYMIVRLGPVGGVYPGDVYGWAKIAAVPLSNGEQVAMFHGPGTQFKQVGVGNLINRDIRNNYLSSGIFGYGGSSGAGWRDREGYLVGVYWGHTGGADCPSDYRAVAGPMSDGVFEDSPTIRALVDAYVMPVSANKYYADGQDGVYALDSTTTTAYQHVGPEPDDWVSIATTAKELFAGGGELYMRDTSNRVYQRVVGAGWTLRFNGSSGDQYLAGHDGYLYRLNAGKTAVYMLSNGTWSTIGGPAGKLYRGDNTILASNPTTGKVYRKTPGGSWYLISDAVDDISATQDGQLYKRVAGVVYRYTSGNWTWITNGATSILPGESNLYITHNGPGGNRTWKYDVDTYWDVVARPASALVGDRNGDELLIVDETSGLLTAYKHDDQITVGGARRQLESHERSVDAGAWEYFGPYSVPDARTLVLSMQGTGDGDLYVREGAIPTNTEWDCRPYAGSSTESCSFDEEGVYYVGVRGYTAAQITLSVDAELDTRYLDSAIHLTSGEWSYYGPFSVQDWQPIRVELTGSGDADLYMRYGSAPTTSAYDCRPYSGSSNETCVADQTGDVYVGVRGYAGGTGSGVRLISSPQG